MINYCFCAISLSFRPVLCLPTFNSVLIIMLTQDSFVFVIIKVHLTSNFTGFFHQVWVSLFFNHELTDLKHIRHCLKYWLSYMGFKLKLLLLVLHWPLWGKLWKVNWNTKINCLKWYTKMAAAVWRGLKKKEKRHKYCLWVLIVVFSAQLLVFIIFLMYVVTC